MNMFMLDSSMYRSWGSRKYVLVYTCELPTIIFPFCIGGGAKLADLGNTKLLAQIPLVQSVREAGDSGRPAVLQEDESDTERFINFAKPC